MVKFGKKQASKSIIKAAPTGSEQNIRNDDLQKASTRFAEIVSKSSDTEQQRGTRGFTSRRSSGSKDESSLSGNDGELADTGKKTQILQSSSKQSMDLVGNGKRSSGGLLEAIKNATIINDRRELIRHCAKLAHRGTACEFGVWNGESLKTIRDVRKPTVYGFDSFNGLPENWQFGENKHNIGHFKTEVPKDMPLGVELVVGLFEDTIPKWLETHLEPIYFVHIDCDLYSSTKTVLNAINDRLVEGSIILFDELVNFDNKYPNWEQGEWKALNEWNRKVKPIFRTNSQQVAFVVEN
jgi:hypothetical protein